MQSLFQTPPLAEEKALTDRGVPRLNDKKKLMGRLFFGGLVVLAAAVGALSGLLLVYSTDLPQVQELEHYRPSSITQVYDSQGRIIGSFALQRRVISNYEDFPPVLRDALISIEDKDFYRHWGINIWRMIGAAYRDVESGGKVQGASTLTMQLARNLFLSPDRSFHRKIQEILLSGYGMKDWASFLRRSWFPKAIPRDSGCSTSGRR